SRMNSKNKSTEVVVALDDRPAAVGPDHRGAWQSWLWFSNLVGLRSIGTAITVRSMLATAAPPSPTAAEAPAYQVDVAWQPVLDLAMSAERDFLVALSARSVPVPDLEVEI